MISAKRYKWLVFIISVLLVANVVLLYMLVSEEKKPGEPKKTEKPQQKHPYGRTGEMLEKEVGFSKEQLERYTKLREAHWNTMGPLFEKMRNSKDSFYQLLRVPELSDSALKNAATAIGNAQLAIDLQTFKHFNEVKALCLPEQREKFDAFIEDVIKKMTMTRGRVNNNKASEDSLKNLPQKMK